MQATRMSQPVPSTMDLAHLQTTFQKMKVVIVAKNNCLGILHVNNPTFRWTIPTRLQFLKLEKAKFRRLQKQRNP